ncbi:MAG: hypothetical protein U9N60_05970 [Thermodesulfobacteriota bacterium]|nr:hypothetical protein [Thermodesulfobacteriota bacterium]
MTKAEKSKYSESQELKDILRRTLYGKKFRLDCGHHITFGEVLGNDLTIRNGKNFEVICALCGY